MEDLLWMVQKYPAGSCIGDLDLRAGTIKIPIEMLDDDRVLRLKLRHQAPVSPAELGLSGDGCRLAYGLQATSYRFCR